MNENSLGGIYNILFLFNIHFIYLPVQSFKSVIEQNKQTPWPLVRKRTPPSERPPFVEKI
jgi:hypothetical protein